MTKHPFGESELTDLTEPMMRLARRLTPTREAAEDLVQDVLLKVWTRLANGGQIDDLRPYLMTALRNQARRPRRPTEELTEANMPSTAPEAPARLATAEVFAAISRLPDPQRAVMTELAHTGASNADIAQTLGLPPGTVLSRMSRARENLRVELNLSKGADVSVLLGDRD